MGFSSLITTEIAVASRPGKPPKTTLSVFHKPKTLNSQYLGPKTVMNMYASHGKDLRTVVHYNVDQSLSTGTNFSLH